MAIIELTSGFQALVDDEDLSRLQKFTWSYTKQPGSLTGYAQTWDSDRKRMLRMHRVVLGLMTKATCRDHIDHVNRNGLDNRKSNLRLATPSQNHANEGLRSTNTSGFKGVTFDRSRNLWMAKITFRAKTVNLGRFRTPEEAHDAYMAKARELFGDFACDGRQ